MTEIHPTCRLTDLNCFKGWTWMAAWWAGRQLGYSILLWLLRGCRGFAITSQFLHFLHYIDNELAWSWRKLWAGALSVPGEDSQLKGDWVGGWSLTEGLKNSLLQDVKIKKNSDSQKESYWSLQSLERGKGVLIWTTGGWPSSLLDAVTPQAVRWRSSWLGASLEMKWMLLLLLAG